MASSDVDRQQIVAATSKDVDIVVWRDAADIVYAHEARCPHNWSHLATVGVVDDCELVCTVHQWRFDCAGRGFTRSAEGHEEPMRDLQHFPCEERDGWIFVNISGSQ
jgi:renierapurpurin 18,18'-hydroxylase